MSTTLDASIHIRIDKETKSLAQRAFDRQGSSLSDACRKLVDEAAADQAEFEKHDRWVTQQVNEAFARYERGDVKLHSSEDVRKMMAEKRAATLAKANESE